MSAHVKKTLPRSTHMQQMCFMHSWHSVHAAPGHGTLPSSPSTQLCSTSCVQHHLLRCGPQRLHREWTVRALHNERALCSWPTLLQQPVCDPQQQHILRQLQLMPKQQNMHTII